MSQNPFGDHNNPYAIQQMPAPSMYAYPQAGKPKYPVFVLVMMIIDLVFLAFRGLLVAIGFFAMTSADQVFRPNDPIALTGWFEVGFGALLFVAGVIADIGILCKQRWGLTVALLKLVGFLGSMFVGVWQLSILSQNIPTDSPQFFGMLVGGSVTILTRTALTVLYVIALFKFNNWLKQWNAYQKNMN
jgi:hypothetical protein